MLKMVTKNWNVVVLIDSDQVRTAGLGQWRANTAERSYLRVAPYSEWYRFPKHSATTRSGQCRRRKCRCPSNDRYSSPLIHNSP